MKQSRFSEEQIIGILKQQERGRTTAEVCREAGISSATFYSWKAKFGGMSESEAQRLRGLEDENAKLRRIVPHQAIDIVALKDVVAKNGDARPQERGGGLSAEQHGSSQRKAACLVKSAPKVLRHKSKRPDDGDLRTRLRELAEQRPRFGYRRLHVLLRHEGMMINRKKTHRLYREEKLHLRPKKRRRITSSARVVPSAPTGPNQIWTMDFVHDNLACGRALNIMDAWSREALAIEARGADVGTVGRDAWQARTDPGGLRQ